MADYNEWDCPHGVHAGDRGACSQCNADRQRRMHNPTHREQIEAAEEHIRSIEWDIRINNEEIERRKKANQMRRNELKEAKKKRDQLLKANKNA